MSRFENVVKSISSLDKSWLERARARQNQLTKPLESLGLLEDISIRLAAIYETVQPKITGKAVAVFAADHGVTDEGVSAYPKAVTEQMVLNFLRGGAAINVLCKTHEVDMLVVDVGVAADFPEHPNLLKRKVSRGTKNMLNEFAMTHEEVLQGLEVGIEIANLMIDKGANLLAAGDMGIGNTTAATAIMSVLTGRRVAELTGRGTGVDDVGLQRKIEVIEKAIALHNVKKHEIKKEDGLELLRCVGGLEIAAMTGFYLACAARRTAVVLDGFISHAAALIAVSLNPNVKDYFFASHTSQNPIHRKRLEMLGVKPIFNFTLRLGEGTGAVLAMPVLESATNILRDMATFEEAGVSEAF
ncbi:MAG: nicotinate-nucleotide--dimethylbenzimidazole phosphoribosyltransferase [Trueperaceae bacterium]